MLENLDIGTKTKYVIANFSIDTVVAFWKRETAMKPTLPCQSKRLSGVKRAFRFVARQIGMQ